MISLVVAQLWPGNFKCQPAGGDAMQLISGKAKTRVNEKKKRCRVKDVLWRWLRLLSGITASPCTDEAADPWTALLFCSPLALTFTEQSLNKGGFFVLFCCMHLVSPKLHWFELSTKQLQIKKGKEKKSDDGAAGGRGLWVLMEVWLLKVNKCFDYWKHFLYSVQNLYPPPSSLGLSAWPDARLCFNQM